tara:strand:- start:51 stop:392 length:342 start_codon:yes stop_codon:yes gene_type:complete
MDILKPIVSIYDVKKDVVLFYLDPSLVNQVVDLLYLDDDNELFLNDKVYCIDRSTLQLERIGTIQLIQKNQISIRIQSGFNVHLSTQNYHIFIKRRKSKKNERDFYKALLNSL